MTIDPSLMQIETRNKSLHKFATNRSFVHKRPTCRSSRRTVLRSKPDSVMASGCGVASCAPAGKRRKTYATLRTRLLLLSPPNQLFGLGTVHCRNHHATPTWLPLSDIGMSQWRVQGHSLATCRRHPARMSFDGNTTRVIA